MSRLRVQLNQRKQADNNPPATETQQAAQQPASSGLQVKPAGGGSKKFQFGSQSNTQPAQSAQQPAKSNAELDAAFDTLLADDSQQETKANTGQQLSAADVANMNLNITSDIDQWPDVSDAPPDGDKKAIQMRELLKEVHSKLGAGDITDALHRAMTFLHDNPYLKDNLMPGDIQILVRGLQSSHGTVIAKKASRKQSKKKNDERVEATMDELADLGFTL